MVTTNTPCAVVHSTDLHVTPDHSAISHELGPHSVEGGLFSQSGDNCLGDSPAVGWWLSAYLLFRLKNKSGVS